MRKDIVSLNGRVLRLSRGRGKKIALRGEPRQGEIRLPMREPILSRLVRRCYLASGSPSAELFATGRVGQRRCSAEN